MNKHKNIITKIIYGVMLLSIFILLNACALNDNQSSYIITYDLNYDGGGLRTVNVLSGTYAIDWQASRNGYRLDGWYEDKENVKRYDFDKKIKSNKTLYAKWNEKLGNVKVTFDLGYAGALNQTLEIEKEGLIDERYKPEVDRFGMKLTGWFLDETFNTEWNFAEDKVNSEMTLYAKYEYTLNIPRNEDNSIKYDNTSVYIWNPNGNQLPDDKLNLLIQQFNQEYDGKIVVTSGSNLINQQDVFLRIQQTPEQMKHYNTYYPIADILSFAGIDVSNSDYVSGAINESAHKGVLLQTPISAVVPYFVYNKSLMQKYNNNKPLPSNYSELSMLLKEAYEGEVISKQNFNSIITTSQWMYKEAPSYTAFSQNGADYYTFKNGIYQNEWYEENIAVKAEKALGTTYDLFGVNGLNHGRVYDASVNKIISDVSSGNALVGMVSWRGEENVIVNNSNLGILPLSGLFTDDTGIESRRVPVHTIGIGFYKGATNVLADPLKVCAAAVFADYVSKHAYLFAENGYVPLSKVAMTNSAYTESTNAIVKLLQSVALPDDFYTLYGGSSLKATINLTAEEILIPYLTNFESSRTEFEEKTREIYAHVAGMVS